MLIFKEGFVRWGERVSSAMVWNLEKGTLPETNIAPENWCFEYYFPIGEAYFQGLC